MARSENSRFYGFFLPGGSTIPKRKENRNFINTPWKKQTFYPPLRDEFTKFGDKFVKIAHNEANGMYCYKRTTSDALTYYEVFKAPEAKDRDGNKYERYPSSSDFGFGVALCIRGDEKHTADKIAFYMANGFAVGRYRVAG